MTRSRRTSLLIVLLLAVVWGLLSCESDAPRTGPPAPSSEPGRDARAETALTSARTPEEVDFVGRRKTDRAAPSGSAALVAGAIAFGVHPGFDRTVLELSGPGEPGWRARYVGSGDARVLEVRLRGVDPPDAADDAGVVLRPRTGHVVQEVRRTADDRGRVTLRLGVDKALPFRVYPIAGPPRLVVDVRKPADPRFRGPANGVPPRAEAGFPVNPGEDTATASPDARLSPVDLVLGRHATFDRVVVELAGDGDPGWTAAYADDPTVGGTGAPIEVGGSTALEVRIDGLIPPAAEGAEPYAGPQRFAPRRTGTIQEVVYGRVVGHSVTVHIGTSSRRPYRVFRVDAPTRVVIDILTPE